MDVALDQERPEPVNLQQSDPRRRDASGIRLDSVGGDADNPVRWKVRPI